MYAGRALTTGTQKLKTWFHNNGKAGARKGDTHLLDLQPKKKKPPKKLSMVQAYSKMFFPTKIHDTAHERYEQHLKDVAAGLVAKKMTQLDHHNKVVREFFESEPPEVITEVAAFREHRFLHPESSDEEDSDESSDLDDLDAEERAGGKGAKAKVQLTPAEAKAKEYNEYVSLM